MYDPKPIDLSDVVLPEDLLELTELIAQNVHDVWAASRIKEGWKYGPVKILRRRKPLCWYHMRICRRVKKTTTAIQHLRH